MVHLTNQILSSLKEARTRKGLNQRELSAKSGVPQSHISKIESGGVDLRVSSLVALARVLELELELVPKKSIPAVKSIVRSSLSSDISELHRRTQQQLSQFGDLMTKVSTLSSGANLHKEMDAINKLTNQIKHLQLNTKALNKIENSTMTLEKALKQNFGLPDAIIKIEKQLRAIKSANAHSPIPSLTTQPAYSLDEVDDE